MNENKKQQQQKMLNSQHFLHHMPFIASNMLTAQEVFKSM